MFSFSPGSKLVLAATTEMQIRTIPRTAAHIRRMRRALLFIYQVTETVLLFLPSTLGRRMFSTPFL